MGTVHGTLVTRERPEGRLFFCWRWLRWFTANKLAYCERQGCTWWCEERGHPSKQGIEGQRWKVPVEHARALDKITPRRQDAKGHRT